MDGVRYGIYPAVLHLHTIANISAIMSSMLHIRIYRWSCVWLGMHVLYVSTVNVISQLIHGHKKMKAQSKKKVPGRYIRDLVFMSRLV